MNASILKEGYLKKKSKYLKRIRLRWMVLTDTCLSSYLNKESYKNNGAATETFDLKVFNHIISSNAQNKTGFELISKDEKREFIAQSIDDMDSWMDVLNPLIISPNTSIHTVFKQMSESVGIHNNNHLTYTKKLSQLWYFRAIDLFNVNDKLLDELKIPPILLKQIQEYVEIWRKCKSFTQFIEPMPTQNNILNILNELKSENKSKSTENDIQILQKTFEDLWLLNIDKIKLNFSKSDWDNINTPKYLKVILLNKIHHHFKEGEMDEKEYKHNEALYELYPDIDELKNDLQNITDRSSNNNKYNKIKPIDISQLANKAYDIEPICTLQKIGKIVSHTLFVDEIHIKKYLTPLIDYKYNRIYHLSLISDELYNDFMSNAPKCLKIEVYNFMMNCKHRMNGNILPFYTYGKISNQIEIDWTMTTDKVFELLESDLNVEKGQLSDDCDILMNNFYNNLWDWFFIPKKIWKSLPYYNKYEIVRIRIDNLMNLCSVKYKITKQMPVLPQTWSDKYSQHLSIEQLLFGGNSNEFSLDGLQWNQNTINKVKLINEYMLKHYVGKLKFLPMDHAKNNNIWTKYMNDNEIPPHIRFKINFYAIKGNMQTDDDWLNNYKSNYPMFAPQFNQHILLPMFFVDDITDKSATIFFHSKPEFDCHIEIAYEEKKEIQWNELTLISSKETQYLCDDLNCNTSYKLRVKYNNHLRFAEVVSFKTKWPEPPVFVVEDIDSKSMKLRFISKSKLECDVEIMHEEKMVSNWECIATLKSTTHYLFKNLKSNNSYQIRARYKNECISSNYSEITSFNTRPPKPKFSIENIVSTSARLVLSNMSGNIMCSSEILDDEKHSKWEQLNTFSNKSIYIKNLRPNHSYKIRARYKSKLTESFDSITSFTTLPAAPLFSIENITGTSATLTLLNPVKLDCETEIKDKSKNQKKWKSGHCSAMPQHLCKYLKSDTSYQIRARYKNKSGYSNYSKIKSFRTLRLPFSIGQKVIAREGNAKTFWNATIKKVNNNKVCVGYDGYGLKYDRWINASQYKTHIKIFVQFSIGQKVRARERPNEKYYDATIVKIGNGKVQVGYDGYGAEYDQWIYATDYRKLINKIKIK